MDLVRNVNGGVAVALVAILSGCSPSYSPNTYAAAAVQQANPVQPGVVVGVRAVHVSADTSVGTVTGAAAGGIAGSQVDSGGPITALSTLGGSVLGGIVGSGVEHATGDTNAFEYIVHEDKGGLVSVTQRDRVPLHIGDRVLVIAGKQARVVLDYTVIVPDEPAASKPKGRPAAGMIPPSVVPVPLASGAASQSGMSPTVAPGGVPLPGETVGTTPPAAAPPSTAASTAGPTVPAPAVNSPAPSAPAAGGAAASAPTPSAGEPTPAPSPSSGGPTPAPSSSSGGPTPASGAPTAAPAGAAPGTVTAPPSPTTLKP